MPLIDVPGDELMRVHELLQRTKEMMDSGTSARLDDPAALGSSVLQEAADGFESSWSDGRFVLGRDLESIRDAAKSVVDAFEKTDTDTTTALIENSPQPGVPAP